MGKWSEMTLSYLMMVEGFPNLKKEVGGSNPGCDIFSLLDGKLVVRSPASYALVLVWRPYVSKYWKKEKNRWVKTTKGAVHVKCTRVGGVLHSMMHLYIMHRLPFLG
jgi:hypothetical protein